MRGLLVFAGVAAAYCQPLQLLTRIPLPRVEGRIDHMAVDLRGQRLFVAALGNNSLEVVDLRAGKVLRTLGGIAEPQGVAYAAEADRIYVASGGSGTCRAYDGRSLERAGQAQLGSDADNVRFDKAAGEIWVGFGSGALGALDAGTLRLAGEIRVEAHPESFQLETSGPRLFVNLPDAGHIAVIDRRRRMVLTRWPVPGAAANFPMALDEPDHRLFIGCRKPARVLVLDTETGRETARFDCVGDTDDLFYDAQRKRIYVSGGEGGVTVAQQRGPDRYEVMARVATAHGARTSLFVPDLDRLYVAVPHRGSQKAEIQVFAVR